jgi:hypothetical protein
LGQCSKQEKLQPESAAGPSGHLRKRALNHSFMDARAQYPSSSGGCLLVRLSRPPCHHSNCRPFVSPWTLDPGSVIFAWRAGGLDSFLPCRCRAANAPVPANAMQAPSRQGNGNPSLTHLHASQILVQLLPSPASSFREILCRLRAFPATALRFQVSALASSTHTRAIPCAF